MKIEIKMISGESYTFENDKFKTLSQWIEGNFKRNAAWFKINEKTNFVINVCLIEKITAEKTLEEKP